MSKFVFLATLLMASFDLAQIASPAAHHSANADARAGQLKARVKSFRLQLEYNGEEDKPFYRLTLSVPSIDVDRKKPFSPQVQITEEQAKKVIDHLAAEGFLDQADELKPGSVKKHPTPAMTGYRLRLTTEQIVFLGNLGWGMPMLKRLDGLRKVLDGDAARQMDFLLGRLNGYREQWVKESPVHD